MDYSEMNLGSWGSYLARFEDLLRPEGRAPLREADDNVEAARESDSAKTSLTVITSTLPNLVFEGYGDWFDNEDEWVLRNLGQVLTPEEEDAILSRLDAGTPETLGEVISYIANERLSAWREVARDEFAPGEDGGAADTLRGEANTANWQASRTPGTYYYTYYGDRYLYSDLAEAPASEWETLPVREQLATDNAQAWGDTGWFLTPVGEPGLYGGAFVYASDSAGSWVTEEQARTQIDEAAAAERRYNPVQPVSGQAGWAQGYDTEQDTWKYAPMTGSDLPGDDAPWAAINDFRADNTEYFVGPGYSGTGWLPYDAVTDGQQPLTEPAARAQGDEVSAEQVRVAAETVRTEIVAPSVAEVLTQLQQRLPAELVAKLGSDIEKLAESAVVRATAAQLAVAQPVGSE